MKKRLRSSLLHAIENMSIFFSNHDVYIWLAVYREANFNYLLQVFYEPTHQNYKSYGPYVPLQHFMTQIDFAYLSSFYAVCCLITDCDNFDLTIVYVIV